LFLGLRCSFEFCSFGGFLIMQKITYPTKTLAQGCEYRPAAHTNIEQTWRKFGWMPLAELTAQEQTKQTVKKAKTSKEVSHA
jgi:hypothetical protein